jgi:hypothetical protein
VADVPAADVPLVDVPAADVPLVDVPAADVPLVDVPAADVPLVDVPLVDVPLVDVPVVDVGPDVAPDAIQETGSDAEPDLSPDIVPDADPDAIPDTTPDVTLDGSSDADVTPACQTGCDCPQGEACTDGVCALGADPVFCCSQVDCPQGDVCVEVDGATSLCAATLSPVAGALVINEILIDGAVSGDPNGDNDPGDPVGDEFVEIVNASAEAIVMDGYTLEETTFVGLPRHTFLDGTTIGPGNAIVVFGGGSPPDDIAGTHFVVANAADVGISFGLALDDEGDALVLRDASGSLVAVFAWGPSAPYPALSDRSYTRSPDVTGDFTPHDDAQKDVLYSPGTHADGTSF